MLQTDASQANAGSPDARNDVDALPAGSNGPATGNVITAAGTLTSPAGADSGANVTVIAIQGEGGGAQMSPAASGPMTVQGRYGTLTIDGEGNYSYVRNGSSPDGVEDVFNYTIANAAGGRDQATLTILLGRENAGQPEPGQQTITTADGVVVLPAGVELSDIRVVGRDLVITLPDGSVQTIPNGAVFVPQLVIGDVEVPPTNLAALLIDAEPQPASGTPQSSGGNFADDVPPLDPGVPLGDLLPPTEFGFTPPVFEDIGQFIDREPEITIQPDGQPAAINAVDSVDESGLPARTINSVAESAGSNASANSETTTGVINVDSPDGPNVVTIVDAGGVARVIVPGLVVQGQHGVLTIGTVSGNQITYSYTLTDNALHNGGDTAEDFAVSVTDNDGDVATATLHIDIIDDVPTAKNDVDSVSEDGSLIADGNVFTGVGGSDANATDGVADTQGADGAHVQGFTFGSTAGAFGTPLAGAYGSLVLNSSGGYTYTLNNGNAAVQALGAGETLTEVYSYTIVDGDGDTSTATLTITINGANDAPTIGSAAVVVSEEGLAGGNPDSVGVPADDTNSATASGTLSVGDVDGDVLSVTLGVPAGAFTSNGVPVVFSVSSDGHTLTGTAGGATVITVTITNAGAYSVTLSDQLDHPVAGVEDEFNITVPVSVSDGSASGSGSITISVEDDSPIVTQAVVSGTVDEDGVPGGVAGGTGDVAGEATVATGSVSTLFSAGADQPLSFSLLADTSGLPALTSNGVAVTYSVVGNTLTASAGGNTVFTFALTSSGNYTFTLVDQLDHPAGNAENDLTISLGSIIRATDADGDSVTANAGGLVITVDDDTPVATQAVVSGTVDEDGVPGGIPGGTGDVAGEATVATGSVSTLFASGADQPLSYSLLANTSGLPALTSNGVAVTYAVVGNTLTASAGGNTVFTFALTADGNYTFTLVDQLDHAAGNAENDLSISLGSIIQATDADGDGVTANAGGLVITVDDDTPQDNGQSLQLQVDEDALPGGNAGGPADGPGTLASSSGSVSGLFSSGADQPLSYALSTDTSGLPALTSGGVAITYSVSGNVLTASAGANTVFTLSIDATTGAVSFDLIDQIDHPTQDGTADDNSENNLVLDFSSLIQATDADGDTAQLDAGSFTVDVDDDTPASNQVALTGVVDEDGLAGGNTAPATGDVAGAATVATGDVTTLFSAGADQPLTIGLSPVTSGLPALTSNGVAVTYSVAGNTLTASAGATPVFTFALASNGTWTFTLLDQLDHAAGDNENDIFLNLSSVIQATDADGDTVAAGPNGLIIQIDDDTPIANPDTDVVTASTPVATGNVLTDAAAGDAGDGDNGADSVGADAPGRVSFIDNSQDGAAGVAVPSGGSVTIAGQYGSLEIFSDGNYTYTRTDGLGGGQNEVFTYTLIDADGDTVTSTLTISIADATPVLTAPPAVQLDDDNALGVIGNPGGVGDDAVSGTSGTLVGTGGDGDLDYYFAASQTAPAGFTYNVVNGATTQTLTITQTSTGLVVTTVTLTNETGQYNVVQNNPVQHAPGADENNTPNFNIGLVAQDVDTDQSPVVNLVINIDDDTPIATAVNLTGTVDEDGVLEGAADNGPGDGIAGGTGDIAGEAVSATGSVATLFSAGADAPLTYSLLANTGGLPALTSGGVAVTYSVVGNTLTASAGGNTVFTFTLNASSGAYNFTLVDQLDHATGANENDLTINLSSLIQATDSDGDSVGAGANGLIITVDDDSPIASQNVISGTVDEDGVIENAAPGIQTGDGIPGGTDDFAGEPTVLTGNINTLFQSGADEPLSFNLLTNFAGLTGQGLTSGGVPLSYSVTTNSGVQTLTASAGGNTVFTLAVNTSTGAYTFTLVDQLDHATQNGTPNDNSENDLTINLSSIIQASDFDGDTVNAAANSFVVTVDDDSPKINSYVPLVIPNTGTTPSGSAAFDFDIGADENADFDDISVANFTVLVNGQPVTETLTPGVETATTASYTFSFNYDTGTGGTATANGTLVFDKAAGTYSVTLTNGPISGFSVLATGSADASDFVSYQVPAGGSGSPEVTVAALDTDFFVQFSGVAEPGSGTGANNLFTTQGAGDAFNPVSTNNFNNLELFTQAMASIVVSSSAAGVSGNTIQGGEVLDLNLYATDPGGTLGGVPTTSATEMFIQLDGIGTSEDMIVVLKLLDTSTGQYTTRAVMVQNGDIITSNATLAGTPYAGITLDNNDGIIIIQPNDYQQGNANLVIVGAQIAGSDEGVAGTAIDLNGALGAGGASTGTQAFSTDVSDAPFKITSIGFLTDSTTDQSAQIDFDVTLEDADGDAATQHVTVNIGDTSTTTAAAALPLAKGTSSSQTSLTNDNLIADSDQTLKSMNAANNNVVFLGAVAAAGLVGSPAAAHEAVADASHLSIADFGLQGADMAMPAMTVDRGDAIRSALLDGGREGIADQAIAIQSNGGHGQDMAVSNGLAGQAQVEHSAPAELLQPMDFQAQAGTQNIAPVADAIAMPSAEMLSIIADARSAIGEGHGRDLGNVVSDALAGGNHGPNLDALIEAVTGGAHEANLAGRTVQDAAANHAAAGADAGSSLADAAVSGWDSAAFAGFTHAQAYSMEALAAHPDAAPAAHAG